MIPPDQQKQDNISANIEATVQGNTAFALELYQQLKTTAAGNLFISPYSISSALAMTYAGARGDTAAQMAQALRLHSDQELLHAAFSALDAQLRQVEAKGYVQLKIANALWPQIGYTFQEAFLTLTKQYYGAQITALDYANAEVARHMINAWVEEKTERKIQNLIPQGILNAFTCLVLVNAIYFKGDWAEPFEHRLTQEAPFWIKPRTRIPVMMMTQRNTFGYAEHRTLQVLELPYAGEDLSMLVLLPKKPGGLARLEQMLTVENLERWTGNLYKTDVKAFLPRFKITLACRLDDTLKAMGMVDAFSSRADFSGIDGSNRLSISAALHKAFVEVNEEGTEAAAATAIIMARGRPAPPPAFRADHPFVFLIRENATGSILFLGRVTNPESE